MKLKSIEKKRDNVRWIQNAVSGKLHKIEELVHLAALKSSDNAQHIHKLRVSTRQAMAAIEFCGECFSTRKARKALTILRRIRKVVGEARDLDVMLANKRNEKQPAVELIGMIESYRIQAQDPVVRIARELEDSGLLPKLRARLLDSLKIDQVPSGRKRFAVWARRQLRPVFEQVLRKRPRKRNRMGRWHHFRLSCKQARYTLELLQDMVEPKCYERAMKSLTEVQEHLGKINDRFASCTRLKSWASSGSKPQRKLLRSRFRAERAELEDLVQTELSTCAGSMFRRLRRNLRKCLEPAAFQTTTGK